MKKNGNNKERAGILNRFAKREWIIVTVILAAMALFVNTNYIYRTKFGLKVIPLEKIKHFFSFKFKGDVKTSMQLNMGSEYILRMDINFPCDDKQQYADLNGNLSSIINDFLIETDHEELEGWIRHGNMTAIKVRLLKIANKYTKDRVTSVYFEALNW